MTGRLRGSRLIRGLTRRFGVHRAALLLGLARLPLRGLARLLLSRVPRDPRLVVFGSPLDRFADNAAYLFLHLSEHPGELRPVWISGSPEVVRHLRRLGYRAERRWSRRGVSTALRAGAYVYSAYRSDINAWLAPGAVTVGLWHGLPVKRVEASVGDAAQTRLAQTRSAQTRSMLARVIEAGREPPPDYLLSSSPFVTSCFSPWFGVPPHRCWELGYPRTDHLLAAPAQPPEALVRHPEVWQRLTSAHRVVGLFLTWRDDRIDDAVDDELIARLAQSCARHGAVLAYKAHYNVAAAPAPPGCVVLPADADLHAYLGLCDVLITDYSSIALDYLVTRRPVVYFMPDVEQYAATRGFAVDPLQLPGIITRKPDALLTAVSELLAGSVSWAPTRADEAFLRRMWGSYHGNASGRIAEALHQHLLIKGQLPANPADPAAGADQPGPDRGQSGAATSSSSLLK